MGKGQPGKGTSGNYIFLIDEAHNLLERGREMYSALLWKEQMEDLCMEVEQTIMSENEEGDITVEKSDVSGQMTLEFAEEMTYKMTYIPENGPKTTEIKTQVSENREKKRKMPGRRSIFVGQGYADKMVYQFKRCIQELLLLKRECSQYCIVNNLDAFVQYLIQLQGGMDDYLSEQEEVQLAVREQLLEFYFEVNHFLYVYDLIDDNYVIYTQLCQDGSFFVKLLCVNPGQNLKNCMLRGRSTILFSATFLPIQYYKKLLGGDREDYEVYARSIFQPEKRALLIASDVTSKYTRRSQGEYYNIARYIEEIVKNRHGNYMVFCPSYAFLKIIYEIYVDSFGREGRTCIMQSEAMSEAEREEFLAKFQRVPSGTGGSAKQDANEHILIGFCVLGGIFSEGIDLKNNSLIGVMIVGTGLPQVCDEREILKDYFNGSGEDGFDYSYRYPGMNKVLQAAGRVIRTVDDVGVIALLDERFLQFAYRRLFPLEWQQFETVTVDMVAKRVERFWDEWL